MAPDLKKARKPRERLASAKNPKAGRVRPTQAKAEPTCPNPDCDDPKVETMDEQKICASCGTLIEDSMIHADVTFGESAAGAAVVQGGFVGEGQRFAKSLGTAFRRVGGTESREVTENQGRDEIRKQCNALRISEDVANKAFRIYKLAAVNGFIQGRRIRTVVASSIYMGCRQQKHNTILMMDFAELLQISVYKIGQCYEDLKKTLYMDEQFDGASLEQVEVESYIERFANRLEFGSSKLKVCEDACRLMKRMKRDWMVTGRAPAGLCGACLILAARMNNFRRTVREVVYVVKVCDITISKRLDEFKRTNAADLTVDQFREFGTRLKMAHDPPAIYEAKMREEKRKRKLEQLSRDATTADSDAAASQSPSAQQPTPPATQATSENTRPHRIDNDGFAIPDLPTIDPALSHSDSNPSNAEGSSTSVNTDATSTDEPPPKRKRGRPKKSDAPPPPVITAEDLEVEDLLDKEMRSWLEGDDFAAQMEEAYADAEAKSKEIAAVEKRREEERARVRRLQARTASPSTEAGAGASTNADQRAPDETLDHPYNGAHITAVSSAEEIADDEFDDDPEVSRCLLTPAEVRVKESIWVTHNEDWLRAQQAKLLKKALDESRGVVRPAKGARRKKAQSRMGDGSVLEGESAASAADANAKMLAKRAGRGKGARAGDGPGWGFSKHVNYEALKALYGEGDAGGASAGEASSNDGASREQSVAAASGAAEATASQPDKGKGKGKGKEKQAAPEAQAVAGADVADPTLNDLVEDVGASAVIAAATEAAEEDDIEDDADDDCDDDYDDDGLDRALNGEYHSDGEAPEYDDDEEVGFEGEPDN